jgi:hypothetical protein
MPRSDFQARKIFKHENYRFEKNKFKCTIYYIKIYGLPSPNKSVRTYLHVPSQLMSLLSKACIPLYTLLHIAYLSSNCTILYFSNFYDRNNAKQKIQSYIDSNSNLTLKCE